MTEPASNKLSNYPESYLLRMIFCLFALAGLTACSVITSPPVSKDQATSPDSYDTGISELAQCKSNLAARTSLEQPGIDPTAIDLLSWNIKKGAEANWAEELDQYSDKKELVLIQEAVHTMDIEMEQGKTAFKSFAVGYKKAEVTSGVATFSSVAPIHECQLTAHEPWLRTPKATNITRYALKDTDHTLVVVNIHMINFTLGHKQFRAQLDAVAEIVSTHRGPLIISGDFNTWRPLRQKIVQQEMARLGLEPVSFPDDHRSRFFGQALDHIFISNLAVRAATAYTTESSDHNPMAIQLELKI